MYEPITYSLLKSKNACPDQLALFKKHFGVKKSIPLTKVVANKFSSVFDVNWASTNLLNPSDLAEYEKVSDQAESEYNKVRAPALAEYEKVRAQAWAEYEKVSDQVYAEYLKVRDQAWAEYMKVCAIEFVRIYKRGLTS